MATLFGWKFEERKDQTEEQPKLQAFTPPEIDDGATYVNAAGMFGTYLPTEGSFQSETIATGLVVDSPLIWNLWTGRFIVSTQLFFELLLQTCIQGAMTERTGLSKSRRIER